MPYFVSEDNLLEAWRAGCDIIKSNGKKCFNLILEINNPTDMLDLNQWIQQRNPKDFGGADNISDVINTIFPYKFYERNSFASREEFYKEYRSVYLKGKRLRQRQSWGTYFQRLINYSSHFSETNAVNQLEKAIEALNKDRVRRNAIVFHLTSVNLDSNTRVLGGPCWQFGEVLWTRTTNTIDLLVVYRNHDYFNKTLGNLIGLSKLLLFLCTESGRNPGKIIVHSANAYYDCNNSILNAIVA